MTLDDDDRELIRRIVTAIIAGRIEELASEGITSRMTDADLADAVAEYGRTLIPVPDDAFELADVCEVAVDPTGRSALIPMFTREEGRSDLTLDVFLPDHPTLHRARIDDLHVL